MMMPRCAAGLILVLAFLSGCAASSDAEITPRTGPLVGSWTYQVPGTECIETHTFHGDGSRVFVSNREQGESAYRLLPELTPEGFFVLVDTITSTNGQENCSGEAGAPVGDKALLYLRFNPSGDQVLMCRSTELGSCFGPFVRGPDVPDSGAETM
jgi:hypothetical protein